MLRDVRVRGLRSRSLRPAMADSVPPRYQLTPFDGAMRFALYQKRILFFDGRQCHDDNFFAGAVASLEESLREVLVSYHPLSGRMVVVGGAGDDDHDSAGLEIDCSGDLSVRFSEAETEVNLEELGNFEPSGFCDSLCEIGCSPKYPWDPELPLLFVQVTRFGCGGLSVGVAFSHQVMDGVSAWNFMNSWADRARTRGTSPLPEVTCYGYIPRKRRIDEDNKGTTTLNGKPDEASKEEKHRGTSKQEQDTEGKELTLNRSQSKVGVKRFQTSRDAIQRLKSAAPPGFTSFELLCADYWQKMVAAVVAAELLEHSDDCYFVILLNCRGRIASIPSSYFGNAVTVAKVEAKVGELLAEDGLHRAASQIHDSIRKVDENAAEETILSINKLMNLVLSSAAKMPESKPGQSVLVVSSPRHPVYECDFGFGRPVGVTFGTNDLGDSKLYLFPAADGKGGVDVTVCMRVEALDKLCESTES